MRHPLGQLPLPAVVRRLVAVAQASPRRRGSGWQRVLRALQPLPDPDPILPHLAFGDPLGEPLEWGDPTHPVEVVPLFWSGGDGLLYGFVWWDACVPPVGVSYAPDGAGASWMGDDPTDAVRNLLSWLTFDAGGEPWADATLAAEFREDGQALAARLELELVEPSPLESGARSERRPLPQLPEGWRHVPEVDGVGTVAPAAAFRPGPAPELGSEAWAWLDAARGALETGHPGSALAWARRALVLSGGEAQAHLAMAAALRALGREPLAVRADHRGRR